MKNKPFSQSVRITFEPSRFSEGQLINVYEHLTPVNRRAISPSDRDILSRACISPATTRKMFK